MAFGAVRRAYRAPCKFFSDDPTAENQIRWYYVPNDRPLYEGWTVFHPRVDTPPNEATSKYEAEGHGRDVRTFAGYTGADVYGFTGDHVHGDDDDFRGISKRKKYFLDGVPPAAPCPSNAVLVRIGFHVEVEDVIEEVCLCGGVEAPQEFDMEIVAPDYPEVDGQIVHLSHDDESLTCLWSGSIEIDGTFLSVEIACWFPEEGIPYLFNVIWPDSPYGTWQLAGTFTTDEVSASPWGFEHLETVAEDFVETENLATIRTLAFVERVPIGISFGITISDPPPPPEALDVAFSLGVDVMDLPPPIEEIGVGLTIGVEVEDLIDPPPPIPFALEIGVEVEDV